MTIKLYAMDDENPNTRWITKLLIPATREQIDAAASEQVKQDAAVTRGICAWLDGNTNSSICISPICSTAPGDRSLYVVVGYAIYNCAAKDPLHSQWYFAGDGKTISAAMQNAGLLPAVDNGGEG